MPKSVNTYTKKIMSKETLMYFKFVEDYFTL